MFKKKSEEDPGCKANYSNVPSGLGAGKILKECRELDAAYDKHVASRENAVPIHNVAAAKARKQAGIPSTGFNRGLSDTGRDRTRGK